VLLSAAESNQAAARWHAVIAGEDHDRDDDADKHDCAERDDRGKRTTRPHHERRDRD
jgi:hypothetical protein